MFKYGEKVHYWTNPKTSPIMPLKPVLYFNSNLSFYDIQKNNIVSTAWAREGKRGRV